jgi:hypothetical protein
VLECPRVQLSFSAAGDEPAAGLQGAAACVSLSLCPSVCVTNAVLRSVYGARDAYFEFRLRVTRCCGCPLPLSLSDSGEWPIPFESPCGHCEPVPFAWPAPTNRGHKFKPKPQRPRAGCGESTRAKHTQATEGKQVQHCAHTEFKRRQTGMQQKRNERGKQSLSQLLVVVAESLRFGRQHGDFMRR